MLPLVASLLLPLSLANFQHTALHAPRVWPYRAPIVTAAHDSEPSSRIWAEQGVVMFSAAAVLGPLCDSCHSRHDVLHYNSPFLLHAPSGQVIFESCWWVPLMFGLAGVILGTAHPLLDRIVGPPRPAPGWASVLLSITCFVLCYEQSGIEAEAFAALHQAPQTLEQLPSLGDVGAALGVAAGNVASRAPAVDGPLLASALAIFFVFERSPGGAFMALLTGAAGPIVEIGLINLGHLVSARATAYTPQAGACTASLPLRFAPSAIRSDPPPPPARPPALARAVECSCPALRSTSTRSRTFGVCPSGSLRSTRQARRRLGHWGGRFFMSLGSEQRRVNEGR